MAAVRRLQLVNTEDEASARRPPAPGIVPIAIATRDMKGLNAHFGWAPSSTTHDYQGRLEIRRSGGLRRHLRRDRLAQDRRRRQDRAEGRGLAASHLLFCLAIGGPAAAKVVSAHIHPIKTPQAAPIAEVLERTRAMLAGATPWLRKVLSSAGVGPAKPDFEEDSPMTDTIAKPTGLDLPFLKTLISVWRAEDAYGVWEKLPDSKVIGEFIITQESSGARSRSSAIPIPT